MRLTCPNCDAQYEVDDRAIPETGRDVQCSNCGHAWFQLHPSVEQAAEAAEAAEAPSAPPAAPPSAAAPAAAASPPPPAEAVEDVAPPPPAEVPAGPPPPAPAADAGATPPETGTGEGAATPPLNASTPAAMRIPAPEDSEETEPEPAELDLVPAAATGVPAGAAAFFGGAAALATDADGENDADEDFEDEEEGVIAAPKPAAGMEPRRKVLDQNVQAVLREEAAREERARRAESGTLETQPELGLSTTPAPAPDPEVETATYVERMRAYEQSQEEAEAASIAGRTARRDLLPDIEEINSTLRATSERGRDGVPALAHLSSPAAERKGFRMGFGLVLLIAVLLVVLYIYAPQISERFPQAGPVLRSYVAIADAFRLWLDGLLKTALADVQGKTQG